MAVLAAEDYDADKFKKLSDREHVRLRYGMYIGDSSVQGLHHLVYELVNNSIDEVMAGHAKNIWVTINNDGSCTVEDDGRGIPVERHEQTSAEKGRDVPTLEAVMTNLNMGAKFDKRSYKTSGGLHGIGLKAVNFLSSWCEAQVCRGGAMYQQEFEARHAAGRAEEDRHHDQARHQDHVQARPDDLHHHQVPVRRAAKAPPRAGVPQ